MSATIQLKRGTAATWITNNPTLAQGELGAETDTGLFKIGDGVSDWVNLTYPFAAVKPNPNMIFLSYNQGLLTASTTIGGFTVPYNLTLLTGAPNSYATASAAATASQTLTIYYMKAGTTTLTAVGTITFAAGANTGTFSVTANQTLNAGDTLFVGVGGTVDTTLGNITIEIALNNEIVAYVYPTPTTDGTLGYFNGTHSGSGTGVGILIFNYSMLNYSNGTLLGSAINAAYATGNSTLGIFAQGGGVLTTQIYTYADNVVSAGGNLIDGSYNGSATGNSTLGIFVVSYAATKTNIYTYTTNTAVEGTALSATANYSSSAGNSTLAIIVLNSGATVTNIYTYSGNTVGLGVALTYNASGGPVQGFGNATYGIFITVNTNYYFTTYDYSANTVAAGSSTAFNLNSIASATGNSVFGFLMESNSNTGVTYEYSNGTITTTTVFVAGIEVATTNGIAGITL